MNRAFTLALIVLATLIGTTAIQAYDCGVPDREVRFGPHRKINEIAFKAWLANGAKDEKRAKLIKSLNMDPKKMPLLTGIGVTVAGAEDINVTQAPLNGTFDWWIVEGGFTADEPEIFNSFRHFYDPLQADGAYHLTDHLKELDWILRTVVFAITKSPYAAYTMPSPNPRVDARDWAINGTQNDGIRPNEYNWNKGLEYMAQAFAAKDASKDKLFVKSWRSLGETMHLMSDMCCPPHVRNDSHPGRRLADYLLVVGSDDENVGMLKNDPYELLATAEVVEPASKQGLVPQAKSLIDGANDPMTLFDKVARYTNHRFTTADTISGTFDGFEYHNNNGRPDYDFPKLQQFTYDKKSLYFTQDFDGRAVRMVHLTWLGENGWGGVEDRMAISTECVKDQAGVLVPIAAYANQKLVDWYVPRVEIKLSEYDPTTKTIKGEVAHTPYGAHTKPLLYNSGPDDKVELYINDLAQAVSSYTVKVEEGKLTLDLSGVDARIFGNAKKLALEMNIGGMMLRSDDFYFLKITPEDFKTAWINTEYSWYGNANPVPEKVKKVSYIWKFSDGSKTMDYPYEKPLDKPFNIEVKHKFEREGEYEVTLEVADVTSGLWIPIYQGKTKVWILHPITDDEAKSHALSFVHGTWIPKNKPGDVTISSVAVANMNRQHREFINVPSIYMPSSASVDVKLTGTQTVEGKEQPWTVTVPVWVSISKYGGPIEAGEIVSAGSLNDSF